MNAVMTRAMTALRATHLRRVMKKPRLMTARMAAKMRKVLAVPTAGMVTKVGRKVPIILPMVPSASSSPTVRPLSSRLSVAYFMSEGVTVPSSMSGNTKSAKQLASEAQTRKLCFTKSASSPDTPAMTYLPAKGMAAVQTAVSKSRL